MLSDIVERLEKSAYKSLTRLVSLQMFVNPVKYEELCILNLFTGLVSRVYSVSLHQEDNLIF